MDSSLLVDGLDLMGGLEQWPLILAETSRLANLANGFWLGLQVAIGLGFVIFVHELGHFLAAKTFGVRCDKFYIGFDVPLSIGPIKLPRTLGKFQWGETEYGIGIIPLGGYVKMLGQDDDPRKAEEEAEKTRLGEGDDAPLDPRSYPAKPVWQRMIIISAGVVMNLIFAVILAAVAYQNGVPYRPTVAGATYGGGPAWAAGIQPGDQIVRVGDMKQDATHLRYDDFRMKVVINGFEKKGQDLPFVLMRSVSDRVDKMVTPTAEYSPDRDIYLVGLLSQLTPRVSAPAFSPDSYLADREIDLQDGDVITAINGQTLPTDDRFDAVLGSSLTSQIQAHWEETIQLSVERPGETEDAAPTQFEVEIPPVPVHTTGIGFAVGPIRAIQNEGLAAKSDLKVGDVIQELNGQPVTDALRLPTTVARLAGQEITLKVLRPSGNEDPGSADETLEITLENAPVAAFDEISPNGGQLTLGGLGVSFEVEPVIKSLAPELAGATNPLQIGDELLQIQWFPKEDQKKQLLKEFTPAMFEPMVIGDTINVASFYDILQRMPVGGELKCVVRRDGKTLDPVTLKTKFAEDWYWHQRGIRLSPLMLVHTADNAVDAAGLGFWETSRRFSEVLNFLKLLVTGQIGSKGLGGPGRIAYAAASEANLGVSRLLLFLTLLSANLAILNFLPIPALDGGHMVFLTAEAIRGKPVSEALQVRLTMVGVLGLLSLMAFVIVKDILWFI